MLEGASHGLRGRVVGTGPPLLLLHGLAGSWRWWSRAMPGLSTRRTVVAIDLPGELRLDAVLERIVMLLEECGGADVVGHSLGGLLAARIAAERPDLVRRLVLVAPAGAGGERPLARWTLPLAASALRTVPSHLPLLFRDAGRAGLPSIWRLGREVTRTDLRQALTSIRAPTLVVWGDRDPLLPLANARVFVRGVPGARLVVIRGAAHVPMVERPEQFVDALVAFLEERGG